MFQYGGFGALLGGISSQKPPPWRRGWPDCGKKL